MAAFLDTNILLYSVSDQPREADKRRIAVELIDGGEVVLSVQVLQEFYVQATRASLPAPMSHEDAANLVRSWSRFHVESVTPELVLRALHIKDAHRISYWDAAIIAAAESAGADTLLTEDLNHAQRIGAVTVINPFLSI